MGLLVVVDEDGLAMRMAQRAGCYWETGTVERKAAKERTMKMMPFPFGD